MAYTEKRKADRAKMAAELIEVATKAGATAAIDTEWPSERAVMIRIVAACGLQLNIDFDGDSPQPDTHVLSWHISRDFDTCLADAFSRVGSVSTVHFHKATSIADGFDDLCRIVTNGLTLAADGTAFDAAREATAIAKAGETAATRNARYAAWRDAEKA